MALLPFDTFTIPPHDASSIPPRGRHTFTAAPQVHCVPLGYIGTAHPGLRIVGAYYGRHEGLRVAAGCPSPLAAVVATWAGGCSTGWGVLQVGETARLDVENHAAVPVVFHGALIVVTADEINDVKRVVTEATWHAQLEGSAAALRRLINGDADAIAQVRRLGLLDVETPNREFYAVLQCRELESDRTVPLMLANTPEESAEASQFLLNATEQGGPLPIHYTPKLRIGESRDLYAMNWKNRSLRPRRLIVRSSDAPFFRLDFGELQATREPIPAPVFDEVAAFDDAQIWPILLSGEWFTVGAECYR